MSGVRLFMPVPTARAVEQTPPDRDRVVDAARAVSLVVVVAGHSIMAVVAWVDGVPRLGNLLAAFPWTQAITWLFQVMPLFFVAGGAANTLSWQRHDARGGSYATWLWARAARLLRPAWVYLIVMSIAATLVTILAPRRVAEPLMILVTQLLWFLGAARFFWGFPEVVGLVNFVLVWTVPAYLGSLRAHGITARYPRWLPPEVSRSGRSTRRACGPSCASCGPSSTRRCRGGTHHLALRHHRRASRAGRRRPAPQGWGSRPSSCRPPAWQDFRRRSSAMPGFR